MAFIRDTVDERIFKRMLARQALAELLLGTDDVARALRLTNQSSLDAAAATDIARDELRKLSPNLEPEPSPQKQTPSPAAAPSNGQLSLPCLRPAWCPTELVDLVEARYTCPPTEAFVARVGSMVEELGVEAWVSECAVMVRVDLVGRRECVAVLMHDQRIECISLADTVVDDARMMEAFGRNAEPGVAGLMLLTDSRGEERIVARAANFRRDPRCWRAAAASAGDGA